MLKIKVKPEVLKELVDVVLVLVDEAKFSFKKNELSVAAVDPAHVAMVEVLLGSQAFEEYQSPGVDLGINLDKVKEVLRLSKPDDIICMEHDEEKNTIAFQVGNITRKMTLMDIRGMSDPKIPNLTLPAKVVVKTEDLRLGVKASETISDHVALAAHTDRFEVMAEGDTDSVLLKLPTALLEELDCKQAVRSLYPLDYFTNVIKALQATPKLTLRMGDNYPLRLEFTLVSGKGSGHYMLAPRIEGE